VSPIIWDIKNPSNRLAPLDLAPNDYVSDFLEKLNLNPMKSMLDKSKLEIDEFNMKSASPRTKVAADVSHTNPLSDTEFVKQRPDHSKLVDISKTSDDD